MTPWELLQSQFEAMILLAEHHLWVSTAELMGLLRLDPRHLLNPQGQMSQQFAWRNFLMRRVKYVGNGEYLWRVVNQERQPAEAPATAQEPLNGSPPSAIVHHGFLSPESRAQLWQYVMAHRDAFLPADTHSDANDYRHTLSLNEVGAMAETMDARLRPMAATVARSLGVAPFAVASVESQILAYTNGCFFKRHVDTGPAYAPTRRISYVYYFHDGPTPRFSGGELVMLDAEGRQLSEIAPQENTIVFIDSRHEHEVRPVAVPSGAFEDSRFALAGWIHGLPGVT